MTVAENIDAVLELRMADRQQRLERLDWLLAEFNIIYVRNTSAPRALQRRAQAVRDCRAMASSPSVMLLDEPFAGIDPLTVLSIALTLSKLRRMGVGVLISDQNVDAKMTIINRAYVLHAGGIVFAESPVAMLNDELVRRTYLGVDFQPGSARSGAKEGGADECYSLRRRRRAVPLRALPRTFRLRSGCRTGDGDRARQA